jgi:hypothetical protein
MIENSGAADVALTPKQLEILEKASREIRIVGDRYPEQQMKAIDR